MSYIPAFCDNCGNVFPGMEIRGRITLIGNIVRCPRCRSNARLLEGDVNVFQDTIQILRGTNATAAQLARLREILRQAQQKQQAPEEVAAAVEREGFGDLAKQLLVPKTPEAFYGLLGALGVWATLLLDRPTTTVYEDHSVHQTIVYTAPGPQAAVPGHSPKPSPGAKAGRNDPCPCGSAKKYKHCCGAIR